ncbi:MAG: hypothetical protein ACO1PI_09355 [Bacteroidota bacterium]
MNKKLFLKLLLGLLATAGIALIANFAFNYNSVSVTTRDVDGDIKIEHGSNNQEHNVENHGEIGAMVNGDQVINNYVYDSAKIDSLKKDSLKKDSIKRAKSKY